MRHRQLTAKFTTLSRNENQARGIAQYAIDFCRGNSARLADSVLNRTEQFHRDSVACAVAALATGTNAPHVLRREALEYGCDTNGATCFASTVPVQPEKAVLANSAAARELDSNGTNFGYNPRTGYTRGEFGHNDFYPVVVAAAQVQELDGAQSLRAMLCLDEIRGRLAECFALKDHKVDHVVHGAIASTAVYGALTGANVDQIESAIGMVLAHYIPFRAIRAGHQLSDSKGASAAVSSEVAVMSMRRAMRGFIGPKDIFRNPQAIFCLFEPPEQADVAPFDLELATEGEDFAIMGMHFKLGLYEHQSAGAIQGLINLVSQNPTILDSPDDLEKIRITIYEPAFGIIGDPAKRDPQTRQSADHSMVYIIATLLRKALESKGVTWKELILLPADYDEAALHNPLTRSLMDRIEFQHGGKEYDDKYPDGIPTTLDVVHKQAGNLSSGLVMYPKGHARNTDGDLDSHLDHKFEKLASLGVADTDQLATRMKSIGSASVDEMKSLYAFEIDGC